MNNELFVAGVITTLMWLALMTTLYMRMRATRERLINELRKTNAALAEAWHLVKEQDEEVRKAGALLDEMTEAYERIIGKLPEQADEEATCNG